MPFYDYRCPLCSSTQSAYRKIKDRDEMEVCCGQPSLRVLCAPSLSLDIQPYVSPASGKLISSRVQRREDLLREGCIAHEPGLREHIASTHEYEKEKAFRPISAAIDQTVSEMCASGLIQGD